MTTVSPLNSFIEGAPSGPWKEGEITSSTADLQITDIPSTAISLDVIITNLVPVSDGTAFYMRTSSDNGSSFDSTAGDYSYTGRFLNSTASYGYNSSASAAFIYLGHQAAGSSANENLNYRVRLFRPGNAGNFTKILNDCIGYTSTPFTGGGFGGGVRESAGKVNAVQFYMSSGNIASLKWKAYLNK